MTRSRTRTTVLAVFVIGVLAIAIVVGLGLLPKGRFMVPQDSGAPLRLEATMPGGFRYVIWPALDATGRQVVLGHVVEKSSTATGPIDDRFVRDIADGSTSLADASRLMGSIAGGFWSDRGIRSSDVAAPGYVWTSAAGSGHFTVDYWEMLPQDRSKMTDDGMEQSSLTESWDRSHVRVVDRQLFEELGMR